MFPRPYLRDRVLHVADVDGRVFLRILSDLTQFGLRLRVHSPGAGKGRLLTAADNYRKLPAQCTQHIGADNLHAGRPLAGCRVPRIPCESPRKPHS